ncbi:hypothetical protein SLEP1_g45721 [Rubroshorea leprosula]|uniref:Uncharacterized protein n=1 Tax=Rubroshorea leprosula TaxID=152421 RepID=A0AAV5LJZ3_9ROSI|nr:hypothetical protein SLEP1_g45721 [Rubroshorea leprosula]
MNKFQNQSFCPSIGAEIAVRTKRPWKRERILIEPGRRYRDRQSATVRHRTPPWASPSRPPCFLCGLKRSGFEKNPDLGLKEEEERRRERERKNKKKKEEG